MDQDAELFTTAEDFTEVRTDSAKNFCDSPTSYDDSGFVRRQASEEVAGDGSKYPRSGGQERRRADNSLVTSRPKLAYNARIMKHEIRIASPCSADWNRMAGDERVRYCPECKLNVYNFSEMCDAEIERILSRRDGRLCARFYQRSDGTMLTRNCPVGFRAMVRRAATFAGAALATVLSVRPALARAPHAKHAPALFQIQPAQTGLALEVFDASGATVPKARVTITDEKTKVKIYEETDAKGGLRLADLPNGNYEITVVVLGFKELKQSHVAVPTKIPLRLQIELGTLMGEVVVVEEPKVEPKSVPVCKTLSDPTSQKPK
jgi:hypothetical protein